MFILVQLPDVGKDLLQEVLGMQVPVRYGLVAQGLEDTFPWGLLVLVVTFSGLFLRRYTLAVRVLEQEAEARAHVDYMLTRLARTHTREQLEKEIAAEGERLFPQGSFRLRKTADASGSVTMSGNMEEAPVCWEEAGRTGDERLYIGLRINDGTPDAVIGRVKFMLRLMAQYIAVIYEYLHLMELKLAEVEEQRSSGQPWASRLFLQLAEKERRRLASDLHDGVLQDILHLRRMTELSREEVAVGLENVEFQLRETCSELMPSFLAEQGIYAAVAKLAEKTRLRADFALKLEQEPLTLSEEQTITVYRIVQELITNAMKHSEAAQVRLRLGLEEGDVLIVYEDDGRGLSPAAAAEGGGLGLQGMQERLRVLGGSFELASSPGEGLRVRCRLPYR